jgi:WD40 repeat protein
MKLNFCILNRLPVIALTAGLGLALWPAGVGAFPSPQWLQGGHAARITGVACSPDGSMIASSSEDGTLKLWSTNGTLLKTLNTLPYPTTAVAWSPNGAAIAAGTYYGGLISGQDGAGLTCVWQAPAGWTNNVGLACTTTNLFGKVTALAFSSDSTKLASGCAAGSNLVTAVPAGSFVATRPAYNTSVGPAAVTSVAFSSGGLMASGCEDGTICVYNPAWTLQWTSTGVNGAQATNVTAVAFSPDGSLLASASLDQTIKIWSTVNWTCLQTLTGHTNGVTSVAFSPDGQELVSGCVDGTVKVWSRTGGACLFTIVAGALPVTATAFTPDGTRVISAGDDGAVRLWSAADGSPVGGLGGRNYFIGTVVVSPDGMLCAGAGGGAVQVWRTGDGALVQTLAGNTNYVSSLAFSPDSGRLASGGGPLDPTIKLWQLSNGALLTTIPATTNGVMALAWSPDGLTLAAGGDSVEQNITFWSTNGVLQGTLGGTLSCHTNGVTALAFSPQGNLLASGGRRPGNMVQVWTNSTPGIWKSGTVVRTYLSTATNNNVECVTFSPDGTLVSYGRTASNVLKIGLLNGKDQTLGSGTNPVYSVAFSPDGNTLAATYQSTVQIWTNGSSWTNYALCDTITNEAIRASCLAYSPNGNLFLCGREDGTVTMSPNVRGALGQPPLKFTPIKAGANGTVNLGATVQPLTHYVLMSSPDLKNWSFLTSAVSSSNTLTLTGLSASNAPARFYLATTPP